MIGAVTRWWASQDEDARAGLLLVAIFVLWGVAGWVADPMELTS